LYVQTASDRDISSQEVHHLTMSSILFSSGGRVFVSVFLFDKNEWSVVGATKEKEKFSFIDRYTKRSERLDNVSLWDCAKYYKLPS